MTGQHAQLFLHVEAQRADVDLIQLTVARVDCVQGTVCGIGLHQGRLPLTNKALVFSPFDCNGSIVGITAGFQLVGGRECVLRSRLQRLIVNAEVIRVHHVLRRHVRRYLCVRLRRAGMACFRIMILQAVRQARHGFPGFAVRPHDMPLPFAVRPFKRAVHARNKRLKVIAHEDIALTGIAHGASVRIGIIVMGQITAKGVVRLIAARSVAAHQNDVAVAPAPGLHIKRQIGEIAGVQQRCDGLRDGSIVLSAPPDAKNQH